MKLRLRHIQTILGGKIVKSRRPQEFSVQITNLYFSLTSVAWMEEGPTVNPLFTLLATSIPCVCDINHAGCQIRI